MKSIANRRFRSNADRLPAAAVLRSMLLLGAVFALPAAALDITTENNPPFNYMDGDQVSGMSTEILVEMGKRAHVPLDIKVLPWARAYNRALKSADTCVYSTVRLPVREATFKWIGPLSSNKWALFAKGDFGKPITTIDDAKRYRIGGVILDAKSIYLKSLGFTKIDLVGDDNLNVAKLISGRIDLWVTGLYSGKESADRLGSKLIKPVLVVRDVDYFLACNRAVPDATVSALSRALHAMREDGAVKAIADRYADRTQ